ncbi:MAG TPA: hypothetical protein DEA08_31620 [Planctomycetes bacterium]|nr:hypothetical protein [Planctomycetota bacterium]
MSKLEKNRASHFKVALNSIEVADFSAARGLDVRTEVLEYEEGGINERTHKIPGPARFARITLEHGSSSNLDLFSWVQKAINGEIERKDGAIMALNQEGTVVARWEFREAWPCGYEGPNFAGGVTEVAIERLTLAHRGFELRPGDVKSQQEKREVKRDSGGQSTGPESDGPKKHSHDHQQEDYPPRTKAAQEECKKVCDAVARAGISKRKVSAVAVFTEEDEDGNPEVVHVGLSSGSTTGENGPESNEVGRERAAALQQELDKSEPPPRYVVHEDPKSFPGYENEQGDPAPGNCAEPKAANGVPGGAGQADGFDVRYRGPEKKWEGSEDKQGLKESYAYEGQDKDPDQTYPQMNPCNTCDNPHNKQGILSE